MTPLLNTLSRVLCDPSLKQKLAFWRAGETGSVASENNPYQNIEHDPMKEALMTHDRSNSILT